MCVTGAPKGTPLPLVLMFAAAFLLLLWELPQAVFLFVPEKLNTAAYFSGVTVSDRTGVMETAMLEDAMQEFLDATGVSPAVEFVYKDEASGNLESYAYDRYLTMFHDEQHWLIELAVSRDFREKRWPKLQWEGMIGDDCYPSISSGTEEMFTKTVNKHLLRSNGQNIEQKLADAWSEMAVRAARTQVDTGALGAAAFFLVFFGLCNWVLVREYVRFKRLKKCVALSETAVSPERPGVRMSLRRPRCRYCGARYNPKTDERCPDCGARIT